MPEVHLVCEGKHDSLDVRVLDAIIAQKLRVFVQISPAGDDSRLTSIRAYLEERSRRADEALSIEDRNFRPRSAAEAGWLRPGEKKLVWTRHEIENYLLDPRVVLTAFDGLRRTVDAPWTAALPVDAIGTKELLIQAARPLLEDHAAKALAWELNTLTTQDNPASFRLPTPAPSPPGAPAPSRAEWLPALKAEALRVSESCNRVHGLPALAVAAIERRYEELLEPLRSPAFFEGGEFLLDLGGHELLTALLVRIRVLGARRLRNADFEAMLVEALAEVYEPDMLFLPDDFVRLRDRLAAFGAASTST